MANFVDGEVKKVKIGDKLDLDIKCSFEVIDKAVVFKESGLYRVIVDKNYTTIIREE